MDKVWIAIIMLLPILASYAGPPVTISNNWVNDAPPTVVSRAAYMTISNSGHGNMELIEITSPAFEVVEMHETKIIDDIVKMQKRERVNIAAGADFHFQPGGYHLMLINPKFHIKEGDQIQMDLRFSNADSLSVMMPVKPISSVSGHH